MRRILLLALLALTACGGPNRPCYKGHWEPVVTMTCFAYDKSGLCTLNMPITNQEWWCDVEGTPYPVGDPRR